LADPWNLHMRECSMVYPGSYTQHKCSARLMYFYWGQNLLQLQLKVWGRVEDEVWHLWVRKLFAYHAHGPLLFWACQFWLACGLGKIWKVHPSVGGGLL
jgi:hypothetical protein